MFPIRDRRGRVISFGGRILGDGQPKYVNGPETALFSKRRTLYALDLAREAVRAGAPCVVVEGYMDVIALHEAGLPGGSCAARNRADRGAAGGTLAPLARRSCASTATPPVPAPLNARWRQHSRCWHPAHRRHDRSAERPGSRRFRSQARACRIRQVLSNPRSLAASLLAVAKSGQPAKTPEQRARVMERLEGLVDAIGDATLKWEYRRSLAAATPEGFKGLPLPIDRTGLAIAVSELSCCGTAERGAPPHPHRDPAPPPDAAARR